MTFVFPPAPPVTLSVAGTSDVFPVNRIFCVGRNYAAHAREMGHDPDREPPFFFQKSPSCLTTDGLFAYPDQSFDVHHEIELAVGLRSGGRSIGPSDALAHVFGYAVALDMTCRDLQADLKRQGRPWEVAKAFDGSAPCSIMVRAETSGPIARGSITLDVNGSRRQSGDLADMIYGVPELIARLSTYFTLRPGDMILTGTPEGIGPVQPGDHVVGQVAGVGSLSIRVTSADGRVRG